MARAERRRLAGRNNHYAQAVDIAAAVAPAEHTEVVWAGRRLPVARVVAHGRRVRDCRELAGLAGQVAGARA